jgi:transcriptional regulator with XRE-family HTH domain
MPRPNAPRSIASEQNLARRIAYERERQGMSYAGLAQRMTEHGCAIDQSALYKIEKANPPRRITVDELVALAQVFETTVDDLLLPPELKSAGVAVDRWQKVEHTMRKAHEADHALSVAWEQLAAHIVDYPNARKVVIDHISSQRPDLTEWASQTLLAGEMQEQHRRATHPKGSDGDTEQPGGPGELVELPRHIVVASDEGSE